MSQISLSCRDNIFIKVFLNDTYRLYASRIENCNSFFLSYVKFSGYRVRKNQCLNYVIFLTLWLSKMNSRTDWAKYVAIFTSAHITHIYKNSWKLRLLKIMIPMQPNELYNHMSFTIFTSKYQWTRKLIERNNIRFWSYHVETCKNHYENLAWPK